MIWVTVLISLLRLVPMIMEMVRDGRIKEATTAEVLSAFETEFNKRWQARIDAAVAVGNAAAGSSNNGVQSNTGTANVTPEGNDPFDRSKRTGAGAKNR